MAKKKTQKQLREEQQKAALRQRLIDIANGAGIDDVECGDYWCYDTDSLERLIRSVDGAFKDQAISNGCAEDILSVYWQLPRYKCLDDLQEWLWGMGIRA
jgi:hypothetical protein